MMSHVNGQSACSQGRRSLTSLQNGECNLPCWLCPCTRRTIMQGNFGPPEYDVRVRRSFRGSAIDAMIEYSRARTGRTAEPREQQNQGLQCGCLSRGRRMVHALPWSIAHNFPPDQSFRRGSALVKRLMQPLPPSKHAQQIFFSSRPPMP